MRWIKTILTALGITLTGMAGGQGRLGGKGTRRFGLPAFAMLAGKFSKRTLPLLLLWPILSIGYGEHSWLMAWLGQDWLVRGVYALMLSLPFLAYGIASWGISALFLGIAYQIRAGSLGFVAGFGDILIEDVIRYLTLGLLIAFVLFRKDPA